MFFSVDPTDTFHRNEFVLVSFKENMFDCAGGGRACVYITRRMAEMMFNTPQIVRECSKQSKIKKVFNFYPLSNFCEVT